MTVRLFYSILLTIQNQNAAPILVSAENLDRTPPPPLYSLVAPSFQTVASSFELLEK